MSDDSLAISTTGLTKRFGAKTACDEICLSVRRGHIFGFLGPNGAGKSTFVKMMVGLISPTSGGGEVLGRPIGDVATRARVGFLPEAFRYQDWLTPDELLDFHGRLIGMDAAEIAVRRREVLIAVGLGEEGRVKIRNFSKGMSQRLGIASALLSRPELLFLDEPTSALDPLGRREVRELLRDVRAEGTTVFLNSHLLTEVESICDEVAVIDLGRVVESGPLTELLNGPCEVEVALAAPYLPEAELVASLEGSVLSVSEDLLVIGLRDEGRIPELVERLVGAGARLRGVARRTRTLESLFLAAVGEGRHVG